MDASASSTISTSPTRRASSSALVAREVALRFLARFEVVSAEFVDSRIESAPPPTQHVIEVTGPYTIETDEFRFAESYVGMEVIGEAGTVIGWDGDREVRTPHENAVLIMPSRRKRKGESAVRFGRQIS